MISDLDTGRCASEDIRPLRGMEGEQNIPFKDIKIFP